MSLRPVALYAALVACALGPSCESQPQQPRPFVEKLPRPNPLERQLKARVNAQADAGDETGAGLDAGAPAQPLPEWAVLPPNPTAADLEQAVTRAAPIARTDRLRQELLGKVALELFAQLRKKDAAALTLAQKWARPAPPAAVAQALADAPLFALAFGVWKVTQGEVRAATALFDRGLATDPGSTARSDSGKGAPEVGYALLLAHRACLAEESANRAQAIALLKKYEERLPKVQGQVDGLSGTFDLEDYVLSGCARAPRAAQLEALPVIFAAQRTRGPKGDTLIFFVRNVTSDAVTVFACSDGDGGWIPSNPVRTRGALHALPAPSCKPDARFLAPNKILSGELNVGEALGPMEGGTMPLIELSVDLVTAPPAKTALRYLLGGR